MTIKVTVKKNPPAAEKKKLLITIGKKENLVEPDAQASVNLIARRTLDGSIIISGHDLIDILIQPANLKVITFTKQNYSDESYNAQSRLFDFLIRKGVVNHDSVQGGFVHGALEATYPEIEDRSALEAVLLMVSKWVNQEKAAELELQNYEKEVEDMYFSPEEEDTTELGEVPHQEENDPQRWYTQGMSKWGGKYGVTRPKAFQEHKEN